jgi:glutathione S-transferase
MMRLRFSPFPGYVHTVEAVITYGGLRDRFTYVANDPFEPGNGLAEVNPLSTVPTLELPTGEALYGGPVIYEYVDSLHATPKLFTPGERLLTVRRQLWLADSLFDHYVRLFVEGREPAGNWRAPYLERFFKKVVQALDAFEQECTSFPEALDIAQVRLIGTLAFITERLPKASDRVGNLFPPHHWRETRPKLAAWYDRRSQDPIFTTKLTD